MLRKTAGIARQRLEKGARMGNAGYVVLAASLLLSGCGGGGAAPATGDGTPQPFFIALSSSMTEAPVPASTSSVSFSSDEAVGGVPMLAGSDGSTIVGGNLTGGCILPTASVTLACGLLSAVSGLHSQTTYTVSFSVLTVNSSGVPGPNDYPGRTVGTFQTQ
jgi:hypothetical protein